jgi:hypothetical protein
MKNLLLIFLLLAGIVPIVSGQSANAPFSETYYHWVDRWEILSGRQQDMFHTTFKPYQRKLIGNYLENFDSPEVRGTERNLLNYLIQDNWEWVDKADYQSRKPVFQYFYRSRSDLYHVKTNHFDLHVNPILNFNFGKDAENDVSTYVNTRGIRIRGIIDDKVGFYSSVTENQIRVPEYVKEYGPGGNVLPHVGFFKGFKEGGYDFFDARGYVSFNASRHVNLQLGHDNFKIGNGYRSMMLSGFGPAYFFLKLQTRVWKINYTNLFTQMTSNRISGAAFGTGHPSKYSVFHHLSLDVNKKLNVGLFEAVVIGGTDSTDADLEVEYLNPIIFYRAVEHQNGSSYNILVGADFEWLPFRGVSVYGQLVFDEFLLNNLKEGNGWWGNKFGIQGGAKWINALTVPTLDLQAELNLARPFTYSHYNTANSYSHYLQPLAHPLGANFNELIFILRYQPVNNLFTEVRLINATKGRDRAGENWGGNILLDYRDRTDPVPANPGFGHEIGQGLSQNINIFVLQASYMLKHNLFIDASLTAREANADEPAFSGSTLWFNGGLRLNIFPGHYDF